MTDTAPTKVSTAAEIETRIGDERRRLLIEQNLAVDLDKQRLAPLEAGDDAALDRVEQQIAECLARQARIQERIEILEKRLEQAQDSERNAELDAIAARAEAARAEGERLIRAEYPRLAAPLGALLKRLLLIDTAIERDNRVLDSAGRPCVRNSNESARFTSMKRIEFTKQVQITPHDPRHSLHGVATQNCNGTWCRQKGEPVEPQCVHEYVDEIRTDVIGADYPAPLFEVVVLPPAESTPLVHESLPVLPVPKPYFEHTEFRPVEITEADIDGMHAELAQDRKAAPKRKASQ